MNNEEENTMIKLTNIPNGEKISDDFSVMVNGKQAHLYQVRVSDIPLYRTFTGEERPLETTELASLLTFEADEIVTIKLVPKKQFKNVTVRPLSEKICPEISDGTITFSLRQSGQYVVELDDPHNALHIFFDPIKDYGVLPDAENTLYFGPGIHNIGQVVLTDGMTVYIDRDAVVYGSFLAYGSENIRILGNGILCGSWYERGPEDILQVYDVTREADNCWESVGQRKKISERLEPYKEYFTDRENYIPGKGSMLYKNREQFEKVIEVVQPIKAGLHFYHCRNVEVNGIILRDVCGMTNTIIACEYVRYENFKIIGMWRTNADGIDFYNSRNCVVKNCFVRTYDDSICIKGKPGYDTLNTENILIENCIIWNDLGRSLEFGVNTVAPEICHITFKDCDIIHHTSDVMDIGNQDRANIHDILFEDIRVEYSAYYLELTKKIFEILSCHSNKLVRSIVDCGLWSCDDIPGKNHHITFRNIDVLTDGNVPFPEIYISGKDAEHTSCNFAFENIKFNGQRLASMEQLNLQLGDYVKETDVVMI